jgi:hypothetical protein
MGSTYETRSAGISPNKSDVRAVTAATNEISLQSVVRFSTTGLAEVSRNDTSALPETRATGTASNAPAIAITRLSMRICETTCDRGAPIATLTAISRSRALARASVSVARLAHVIRRTSPVSPKSRDSDDP